MLYVHTRLCSLQSACEAEVLAQEVGLKPSLRSWDGTPSSELRETHSEGAGRWLGVRG